MENKIYTEIDGYRKYYFENGNIDFPVSYPELIDEYFNLSLNKYLSHQKAVLKSIYNEANQIKKFFSIEITKAENRIDNIKAPMGKMLIFYNHQLKLNQISIYEAYVEYLKEKLNTLPQQLEPSDLSFPDIENRESKSDFLKARISEFGFFELPKVAELSEESKLELVKMVSEKGIPYAIAMFDYLGFLKHLDNEYFRTKTDLQKNISKWFKSDKDGRTIKGNINALSKRPENNRYTADLHKEIVIQDYGKLKKGVLLDCCP